MNALTTVICSMLAPRSLIRLIAAVIVPPDVQMRYNLDSEEVTKKLLPLSQENSTLISLLAT
jgi:hypothetical protein